MGPSEIDTPEVVESDIESEDANGPISTVTIVEAKHEMKFFQKKFEDVPNALSIEIRGNLATDFGLRLIVQIHTS